MTAAVLVAPVVLHVPPGGVGSFADDVCEVAERLGRPPEPEQRLAIDALTARDERDRFLSFEAGVETPRQNGKTGGVMLPVIAWTALTDPDLITWTSHRSDTHLASFREFAGEGPRDESGLIASCDWLRRRVAGVSWKDGEESVSLRGPNGLARIEWRCRSAGGGRGRSGATNFTDEALLLSASSLGAMLPTLATRSMHGNARQYYASSAPTDKPESAHLRSLIRRAAVGDDTLTWVAWRARGSWADPGCELADCSHEVGSPGCALDDEDRWAEANLMLGRLTSLGFLRTMRRTLPPREFGREFLGWGEGDDAVSVDAWRRLADPGSVPLARPVRLAFDVAPRLRSAAVVAAGRRRDGLVHVELLEHRPGVAWLGEFLAGKQSALGGPPVRHAGGRAPAMAVVPDLVKAGVRRVEPMSDQELAAGCGGFDALVMSGGLRHLGEARLTLALTAAVRVGTGDGSWLMSRKGSVGDISPAVAAVIAVRDLLQQPSYSVAGSVH